MILSVAVWAATAGAYDVLVRPDGDDALGKAFARVRALRRAGEAPTNEVVEMRLAAGTYRLRRTLYLGVEDSLIRVVGVKGATRIVGLRDLGRMSESKNGLWSMRVPDGFRFEQLFVNGHRAQRAHEPDRFHHHMVHPLDEGSNPFTGQWENLNYYGFYASPEDVRHLVGKSERELSNVVVRTIEGWSTIQARIRRVDRDGRVFGTRVLRRPYFSKFFSRYEPRYELENFREALDEPGEWFLDDSTGRLLYKPRTGERIDQTTLAAPVIEKFMVVAGRDDDTGLVHDLSFENLTFSGAGYGLPPEGEADGQGVTKLGASIEIDHARNVTFRNCTIRRTGLHGLWFRRGCRHCELSHSIVEDVGAGAVRIGDDTWDEGELPDRLTAFVLVDDCILRMGGRLFPSGIGILLQHASDCRLTHNDIGDFYYTGVSVGWTWGYRKTVAHRNLVADNHIHHIGQGVLSDMGGVYTLGASPGTVIRGNHIHDVYSNDFNGAGGWGLYTDEGSRFIRFESNLVHHVKTGCAHQHYGSDNLFFNNIFAFSLHDMIVRSRIDPGMAYAVSNNVVYWDNSTDAVHAPHPSRATSDDLSFGRNLYWSTAGITTNSFMGSSWEGWRRRGQDVDSLIADPQFVDAVHGDFRLKPTSPAFGLGFTAINPRQSAGVLGRAWRAEASRHVPPTLVFEPDSPVFGRSRYFMPFEAERAYDRLPEEFDVICPPSRRDLVRLSQAAARHGRRGLEIRDAKGLDYVFQPMVSLGTRILDGKVCLLLSLKGDARTDFKILLRDFDGGGRYHDGPFVDFRAGGVFCGSRKLAAVQPGVWHELELAFELDGNSAPVYSCRVTAAGGETTEIAGLTCRDPQFRRLTWIGLLSMAQDDSVCLIDDIKLENGR